MEKSKINKKLIEKSIRNILVAIGENPDREGLVETPSRVARMYEEIFEGIQYSNEEIAKMFNKCFEDTGIGDLVIEKDIPVFSYCEHHMALMYDMNVTIAYIPNGKVLGLSKMARIADMVAKRLQLQERIGTDIADIMQMVTGSENVAVIIKGSHSCMTARGVKKPGITETCCLRGSFKTNGDLRQELYTMINK